MNFANVPKATPSIATVASATANSVVGSAILGDTATVTGGYSPTGSVRFTLTAPDGVTIVDDETVALSGGSASTANTVYATQVGTYTWHATYLGDDNNNLADDDGDNESVTIVKAGPSIATSASATANSVVGSAILGDTATVTGGYSPTGSVRFTLTAPDGVTIVDDETVALSGGSASTANTVYATQVGTYTWHATYLGDDNNNLADDDGDNESVTVVQAGPSINTVASDDGTIGIDVFDTATLSGSYNATGTITFTVTIPGGTTVVVGSVNVDGDGTYQSPNYTPTQAGSYVWHATYNGDDNNLSASESSDNAPAETVTLSQAIPSIVTTASATGNVVGSTLKDQAILSGGYAPGGTITFTLTLPNNSTITVGSVSVTGNGTYNSPTYVSTQVGTYTWHATYNGDNNNSTAIDNGVGESVTICATPPPTKTQPKITTVASFNCGNVVGQTMSDKATLASGTSPTGTIVFTLTTPSGSVITVGSVTVTGNGTYTSPTYTATQVGTYTWHAHYNGDGKNYSADDNGVNETLITVKASPSIVTTPCVSVITCSTPSNSYGCGSYSSYCGPQPSYSYGCGSYSSYCGPQPSYSYGCGSYSTSSYTLLTDSATLSGSYKAGGTITFNLVFNGKIIDTETVKVTGNGTYTTPNGYKLPSNATPGIYQWNSYYSGDSNNSTVSDVNNSNEQVIITNSGNSGGSGCGSNGGYGSGCGSNSGSSTNCGQTGDNSFWCGSRGQALIKCFNGGSSQTGLGNWLASTCPNLFGSLKGCTNSQVASYLQSCSNSYSKQANAQTLCLALNVYATNSCLSGNCGQSYYGFTASGFGLGSSTCFLGSHGSEVGLSDNGSCTINNLLKKIDSQCRNGVINSNAYNAVNSLCGSINQI